MRIVRSEHTLAWFACSRVSERKLTSGRLTDPSVTPEFTYRTSASLTIVVSVLANLCKKHMHTFYADGSLSLLCAAANVRGQNDILQTPQILRP